MMMDGYRTRDDEGVARWDEQGARSHCAEGGAA